MALELTVVTPEREVFTGEVHNVVLPGLEGDFGVLEDHERFLTPLRVGEAEIHWDGKTHYAAVNEGFAEVGAERVVVMVDSWEMAEDIDTARAEAARARAEKAIEDIRSGREDDTSLRVYEGALQRAVIRIQVAHKLGGRSEGRTH